LNNPVTPPRTRRLLGDPPALRRFRQIGAHAMNFLGGDGGESVGVNISRDDDRAAFGEMLRRRAANARGRPRHDDHTRQLGHDFPLEPLEAIHRFALRERVSLRNHGQGRGRTPN
jgi:hypothetical protein